jgi:hypothetical protein
MSNGRIIISEATQAINVEVIDPSLIEQAENAELERQLLHRVHPTAMERMAHRTNDCDGSCSRMYNGFEHLLDS